MTNDGAVLSFYFLPEQMREFGPLCKFAWRYASLFTLVAVVGLLLVSCNTDPSAEPRIYERSDTEYETKIVSSRSLGTLAVVDPVTNKLNQVECAVCHGIQREAGERVPENLHKDMLFSHGEITCNSCHSQGDRSTLHLADGEEIAYADTIKLCAQCHGPQYRDYQHGSHGGMSGFWDKKRGQQVRNHCVNCHDPHVPAYPMVQPAPGPKDRFLTTPEEHQ